MRLRDPRRFGLVLWHQGDVLSHPLLKDIGPEPLGAEFDGAWLYRGTRNRSAAIKQALMDSHLVAGLGNIYANEALFRAGINPATQARRIGTARYRLLADTIRKTLNLAIGAGGSSLRDYVGSDGLAGNFQNNFFVYGRAGQPCFSCGTSGRDGATLGVAPRARTDWPETVSSRRRIESGDNVFAASTVYQSFRNPGENALLRHTELALNQYCIVASSVSCS